MTDLGSQRRVWTHPSVVALRTDDPVSWVTERARSLAFAAAEAGWSGPPFDPIPLAEMLGLRVQPSQEVLDARLVAESGEKRIDFNPNRPAGRIRYSIAHEIGHVLFPDYAAQARHRLAPGSEAGAAESELEMLCNLAAAELLMPIGSFPDASSAAPSVDLALDLRARFDLSMEAVLLRVARLAMVPTAVFTAAPRGSLASDGYRLDYVIKSAEMQLAASRGYLLPQGSHVTECTAVGFTASGLERWGRNPPLEVQCVGIPPYPGDRLPRVAGLVLGSSSTTRTRQSIRYLVGNALAPRGDGPRIIAQVVNDATPRWGGGFARELGRHWMTVQDDFASWSRREGGLRLGQLHLATATDEISVASMVAQHGYGPSDKPRIRYAALDACLRELADEARRLGASVHVPRIGAGQAGGRWPIIAEMIEMSLVDRGIDVTVYDLPGAPRDYTQAGEEVQIPLGIG